MWGFRVCHASGVRCALLLAIYPNPAMQGCVYTVAKLLKEGFVYTVARLLKAGFYIGDHIEAVLNIDNANLLFIVLVI